MTWTVNGITGRGDPPACAGGFKGLALVLGTARSVWWDVYALPYFTRAQPDIIAINGMVLFFKDRIHHAVSMHPPELDYWRKLRKLYQGRDETPFLTHSYRAPADCEPPDVVWDMPSGINGTSGLLAVMVGLALGYNEIILAGVPMDGQGHIYDPPGNETADLLHEHLELEWKKIAKEYFQGRVRSMSGRTREWLGEPTEDWLRSAKMTTDH